MPQRGGGARAEMRDAFKYLPPVIRDAVIRFAEQSAVEGTQPSTVFEYFATYHVLRSAGLDEFDLAPAIVAGEDDTQLDAVAITINGQLVTEEEDADRLLREAVDGQPFDVRFIFVQATMGMKFSAEKIALFLSGVVNFLLQKSKLRQSESLVRVRALKDRIMAGLESLGTDRRPRCDVFAVWPGTWTTENHSSHATGVAEASLELMEKTRFLASARFHRIDSVRLQSLIVDDLVANEATLELAGMVELPAVAGVSFGCTGTIRALDYLACITVPEGQAGAGRLMEEAFHGNVRAFLGPDERVNQRIRATLADRDGAEQGEFILRNNGVTIIAEEVERAGEGGALRLKNFQIVNGCQTSQVLYHNRALLRPDAHLQIKIVATRDPDIAQNIILGLNRQTPIDELQIVARNVFVRRLKHHFDLAAAPREQWIGGRRTPLILFERRSGEYRHVKGEDRIRIVSLLELMQAYSSAFLEVPHTVHEGHREFFLKQVPRRLFDPDHDVGFYFISALLLWRARREIGSFSAWGTYAAKHQLVYALRHLVDPQSGCPTGRRDGEAHDYLRRVRNLLQDEAQAAPLAHLAAEIVLKASAELAPPPRLGENGEPLPFRPTTEISRREATTARIRELCLAARSGDASAPRNLT